MVKSEDNLDSNLVPMDFNSFNFSLAGIRTNVEKPTKRIQTLDLQFFFTINKKTVFPLVGFEPGTSGYQFFQF